MPLPTVERVEAFFEFLRERLETARKWAPAARDYALFRTLYHAGLRAQEAAAGAPERLTIDIDATPITSDSEKEHAVGSYQGGYGFHPLQAYADQTRKALGAKLRAGNAGANTAADHVTVLDLAIVQIPAEYVEQLEILVRADSAGATHELADHCHERDLRCSFG